MAQRVPPGDAHPVSPGHKWRDPRRGVGLVTVLVLVRAAVYALLGAGFVLDDWGSVGHRQFEGAFQVNTSSVLEANRPGQWVVHTLIYTFSGDHPVALFAAVTVLNVLTAAALYFVLLRFSIPAALPVTIVWVLLPNHNSLTVWAGSSQTLTGLLLLLVGTLALTHGRWMLSTALLAGSLFCYELYIPACFAVAILLPSALQRDQSIALRIRYRTAMLICLALATGWMKAHATYPLDLRVPNPVILWSAHFGTGLFGTPFAPAPLRILTMIVVGVGTAVCLVAFARGERDRDAGPTLVVAGLVTVALGSLGVVSLPFASVGISDRLFAVTSIGSALILVGIGTYVWRWSRHVVVAGAVVLCVVTAIGQFASLRAWSDAGRDVVALMHLIERTSPDPANAHLLVGPEVRARNGVTIVQTGSATWAQRLYFGDGSGTVRIAQDQSEFDAGSPDEQRVRWSDVVAAADDP